MQKFISFLIGVTGSLIAGFFGGWTEAFKVLFIFMAVDYISGIIVAGVFKNSTKTETGALQSHYCWKGLAKKVMTIVYVGIGYQLDVLIGSNYIKDAVCIAFIVNELLSIVENAGLMGIPIPTVITNAIDILKKKSEVEENEC